MTPKLLKGYRNIDKIRGYQDPLYLCHALPISFLVDRGLKDLSS